MSKISFNIPAPRESIRIALNVSAETSRQLQAVRYKHQATMNQIIEMLVLAALPEYFEQYPIEDIEKLENKKTLPFGEIGKDKDPSTFNAAKDIFAKDEKAPRRRCSYSMCPNKGELYEEKDLVEWNDTFFCTHSCLDEHMKDMALKTGQQRCYKCAAVLYKDNKSKDLVEGKEVCLNCFLLN